MARHRDHHSRSGEPVHEVLAELPPTDDLGNPQTLLSDFLVDNPDVAKKIGRPRAASKATFAKAVTRRGSGVDRLAPWRSCRDRLPSW